MKHAALLLVFLPSFAAAQTPMFGLTSDHHLETVGSQGNLHRVNIPVTIVYNNLFCWYKTPHGDVIAFRTRAYSKTLNPDTKSIHESFLNDDCPTARSGFYTILIDQTNVGTTFQIASPTGTIVVQHAKRISQSGPVPAGAMKIDWTAVRQAEQRADSLKAGLIKPTDAAYRDSLFAAMDRRNLFIDRQWSTKELEERNRQWMKDSVLFHYH